MGRFLARRALFIMGTLFLTTVLVFLLTRVLPGDVARVLLGREASAEEVAAKREELGLNEPLVIQYVDWAVDFVRGDWGETFSSPRQEIRPLVSERLINSARLGLLTLAIALPLGIALGVLAGLSEGSVLDGAISIASLSVVSLPEFVTGLFL